MATPAREPFRLVPSPAVPNAESSSPALIVWGAYPAMRAGIRALLAEMDIEAEDASGQAIEAGTIVIADAGEQPVAQVVADLVDEFGASASLILLAGEAADFADIPPGPGMPAGLLLRDVSAAELAAAVGAVRNGLAVLDPEVASVLSRNRRPSVASTEPAGEPLTARELDVLRELSLGLPNKTIALRLGISEHTVKYHVGEILGKLDAASRTEAVMLGARRGLLPL